MKIFVVDKTKKIDGAKSLGQTLLSKYLQMSLQCVYICKNNFI